MSEPFFHRLTTHHLMSELSKLDDWTIYVGLGATIDRTGLSWAKLIEALLGEFIKEEHLRKLIVGQYGETRSATLAKGLYKTEFDDYQRIVDETVRKVLYGPHKYLEGRLLKAIVALAQELALQKRSVALVTPNYDDYMYTEMLSPQQDPAPFGWDELSQVLVVAGGHDAGGYELPDDWRSNHQQVVCCYLHGYIPSKGDVRGQLVLSEHDYSKSHERTVGLLTELFRERNVLIVGSSLTDPPLVDALIKLSQEGLGGGDRDEMRESTWRKYALLPLQDPKWTALQEADKEALVRWDVERLGQLGVTAIHPDFYVQSTQFLLELERCVSNRAVAESWLSAASTQRYGSRLAAWWDKWFIDNCTDVGTNQARHVRDLQDAVERIRRACSTPAEERLKAELWVRWDPRSNRKLKLWAASTGTWPDHRSMREAEIDQNSPYKSVEAFCIGSPSFLHATDDGDSRWLSYLAFPIWLEGEDEKVPVAVVSLASMWPPERSSVSERNLARLKPALALLRHAAVRIVEV